MKLVSFQKSKKLSFQQHDKALFTFQLFYIKSVFDKGFGMNTLGDKVSSFLKGPGWFPGTERLGDLNMVPEVCAKPMKLFQLNSCLYP